MSLYKQIEADFRSSKDLFKKILNNNTDYKSDKYYDVLLKNNDMPFIVLLWQHTCCSNYLQQTILTKKGFIVTIDYGNMEPGYHENPNFNKAYHIIEYKNYPIGEYYHTNNIASYDFDKIYDIELYKDFEIPEIVFLSLFGITIKYFMSNGTWQGRDMFRYNNMNILEYILKLVEENKKINEENNRLRKTIEDIKLLM